MIGGTLDFEIAQPPCLNRINIIGFSPLLFFLYYRWESKYENVLEKNHLLTEELTLERKTSNIMRNELESIQNSRYETSRMESLLQRYEQRVFDLEELEVELREKVSGLEWALWSTLHWSFLVLSGGKRLPTRAAISNYTKEDIDTDHEDMQVIVKKLEEERNQLKLALNQLALDKESLAMSLEGNVEQRIEKVLLLEDHNVQLAKETEELKKQVEGQVRKISKLESEIRELSVKEQAYKQTIEQGDEILKQKQMCLSCKVLETERSDLAKRTANLERENSDLLDHMEHLREVERRFKDVQQSEEFLRGRVEELEQTEVSLRSNICSFDRQMSDREVRFQRKIDDLEDELKSRPLEPEMRREEGRHSLRIQVEGLKQKVGELNQELGDKSMLLQETEASLRSEVRLLIPASNDAQMTHKKSLSRTLTKIEIGQTNKLNQQAVSESSQASTSDQESNPSPLVRYKSLRDQQGKFSLVVKIR